MNKKILNIINLPNPCEHITCRICREAFNHNYNVNNCIVFEEFDKIRERNLTFGGEDNINTKEIFLQHIVSKNNSLKASQLKKFLKG